MDSSKLSPIVNLHDDALISNTDCFLLLLLSMLSMMMLMLFSWAKNHLRPLFTLLAGCDHSCTGFGSTHWTPHFLAAVWSPIACQFVPGPGLPICIACHCHVSICASIFQPLLQPFLQTFPLPSCVWVSTIYLLAAISFPASYIHDCTLARSSSPCRRRLIQFLLLDLAQSLFFSASSSVLSLLSPTLLFSIFYLSTCIPTI